MRKILPLLLLPAAWLRAELVRASVFADHMVLQRDQPPAIGGRDAPGELATVEIAGEKRTADTDAGVGLRVRLGAQAASATACGLRISTPGESREHTDVRVGEVWLCAGQSNMDWTLTRELHDEMEIPAANHPVIRFLSLLFRPGRGGAAFSAADLARLTPQDYYRGACEVCSPQSATRMSAVGCYAARELRAALGVPVGIFHLAVGGSPAEAWMRRETLAGDPALRPLTEGEWLTNPALETWRWQRGQ